LHPNLAPSKDWAPFFVLRFGVILLKLSMAVLIALAWMLPTKLWQWRLSLWVLECGHWLAVSALITGFAGALLFRSWLRWLALALGSLLALTLMIPAVLASQMDPQFQIGSLWSTKPVQSEPLLPLAPIERKIFFRNQNDTLEALVLRPSDIKVKRPCIVMLHGGGWDSGDVDQFLSWDKHLAAHGFVVVSAHYHLAPKFKWPRQKEDVQLAVEWARQNADAFGLDPQKVVLAGRSAGGQIASVCALTMPELNLKGCICFYSPLDMDFGYRHGDENDLLKSPSLMRAYLGGDPETVPEAYKSSSAINFVSKNMPPMLLLHGKKDALVWVEHMRKFKGKCEAAGVGDRCTAVELPWATHGFDYFVNSPGGQLALHEMVKFVREKTKVSEAPALVKKDEPGKSN
jgi:acetyl esterase/lipase